MYNGINTIKINIVYMFKKQFDDATTWNIYRNALPVTKEILRIQVMQPLFQKIVHIE